MYSLLKKYKNLENRKLIGQISKIERLIERSILIQFFPQSVELQDHFNYCPITQEYFTLKNFLAEDYFVEKDFFEINENGEKILINVAENPYVMINENVSLKLKNSSIILEECLYKKFLHSLVLKKQFKLYKKFFNRLEKKFRYVFLKKKRALYFNRNIYKYIYIYDVGHVKTKRFLKKFIQKIFLLSLWKCFKKNQIVYGMLSFCNNGGLLFSLPGLYQKCFMPFGFLQARKKFSIEKLQINLKKNLNTFFYLTLHSLQKTKKNHLNFIVKITKYNTFLKKKIQFKNSFIKKKTFGLKNKKLKKT